MQKLLFSICIAFLFISGLPLNIHAQCAGNCGQSSVNNCGCDSDCWLYGDCCPDIEATCPDIRPSTPNYPGLGGVGSVEPLACNVNSSICTPGVAGPFTFTSPGPPVSSCLDWIGNTTAYIMLHITQTGNLNMLINGNSNFGFLDVAFFNIPQGQNPCTAIQSTSNQLGCNYASSSSGCNQFGNSYPCASSIPAIPVTAGQVLMIVVENWSGSSSSFTLQLGTGPGSAGTGPPSASINNPPSTVCLNSAPVTLTPSTSGGIWSGPGISPTGVFNPTTAGIGTHNLIYNIGVAPCNSTSSTIVTVTAPSPAAFTTNSAICAGQTISLTAVPGPAGSTYHWSGPGGWTATGLNPTRPQATPAMSGNYSMYMVTAGCTSTTVTQPYTVNAVGPAPTIVSNSPVCYGNPILLDGPTEPGAEYFWSGPNGWTNNTEDPQIAVSEYEMAGQYSLYIISANGCTSAVSTHNMVISTPPKPVINQVVPQCFGAAGLNLDVDLPNGTYTGTGITDANSGYFDPIVAGPGTHQIIYTIPQPCGSADTLDIIVSTPIQISGVVKDETCKDVGDGSIHITTDITSNNSYFNYLWSNNATTQNLDSVSYGNYSVVLTDQYGCQYDAAFSVFAGNSLAFTYVTNHVLCSGEPTGNIQITSVSGTPPHVYTVNGIQTSNNPITNLIANSYQVTITDSRGCDTSFSTQITQPPLLFADSTKQQIRLGDYTTFSPQIGGGTGNLHLYWSPNYNINCNDCLNPMAWPERSTSYTLHILDENGCEVDGEVLVDVYHDGPFIPNSFSPGKDGLNDEWKISDYGIKNFEVIIFDRWGSRIFYSDNIYKGWDGKLNNGNYYESGVYVYKTNIRYLDGQEKTLLGNITLLR